MKVDQEVDGPVDPPGLPRNNSCVFGKTGGMWGALNLIWTSAALHPRFVKDTKNSMQFLRNPKVFSALAMAMSTYKTLCVPVLGGNPK